MSALVAIDAIEPGISSLTLNRPERRNALSVDLLEQLGDELAQLGAEASSRVVIVRGAGPVFSAGLDLREAADNSLVDRSAAALAKALKLLRTSPLVHIAAVQGGAFAGGAGLMAACDFVIAADDAKVGFPEARRGLLPALIGRVLRHKVRDGDLRELFLTGEPIGAARAQQVGLVQRVVPTDRLMDEALAAARSVAAGGPETIRQTKALLNEMYRPTDDDAEDDLVRTHLQARHSDEAREGLAAFVEKRTPNWP